MDEKHGGKSARDDRRRYELRVTGHLDARWADWFDGLTLTPWPDGTTTIRGTVADQAALHGVLERLRDLGLPLISVEQLGPDETDQRPVEPRQVPPQRNDKGD